MGVEEKALVYVAGNPSGYPLEYYDPSSQSYQGVIPQLLEQFADQYGYRLEYYSPGARDRRRQLAKNLQVDLVSGYRQGEDTPDQCQEILLFQADYQGETLSYYLCATSIAPEGLKQDLEEYIATVSQRTVTGILMQAMEESVPSTFGTTAMALGGVAMALAILAAAAVLVAKRKSKQLREARFTLEHDADTGLGNINQLERYYRQRINDKNRILYSLLYVYVDTDHLHRLVGGKDAEEVLQHCATVLRENTAQTDLLARVSANGFVLLQLSGNQERIRAWVASVLQRIRSYPKEHAKPFEVEIAVGVYQLQMDSRDLDEMVFRASQEAQYAIASQEDCRFFNPEARTRILLEQKLQATVSHALDSNEFQLYVQFYVDAQNHRIVGGESLSRWMHPERGLLLPGVFVPVLEKEGLIYKLDYHCLRNSCMLLQELSDCGIQDFFLSCNFSRNTFAAPDFVQRCREIIDAYSFPHSLLIFELTESVSSKSLAAIQSNMQALKRYGVRIALDDFGHGFTSFSDLQEYPVDGIKLDKGLIDNILTKTTDCILRAMIRVGHEMGLTILAEGVENEPQARALQAMGCDVIQGFRFYAPIPSAEVRHRLLQEHIRPS